MYEALKDIACVVTAFISFLYGTRVAWGFGKKSPFSDKQDHRIQFLIESVPSAAVLYFVGFLAVFSYWVSSLVTLTVLSLTSAIVLSIMIVAISMPELKNKVAGHGVVVELSDGSICSMAKSTFEYHLSSGKVVKFKRADGWVVVGQDQLRQESDDTVYVGVDRREPV